MIVWPSLPAYTSVGHLRFITVLLSAATPLLAGSASGVDPDRLARAHAQLDAFVEKGSPAGVVTLLSRNGSDPIIHTAGFMDR